MTNRLNPRRFLPKSALQVLSSGVVLAILAAAFVLLGFTEFRDWQKKRQVDAEIQQLTEQAAALEEKNKQLNDSLSFLNSENFQEKIARQQLNLKKDGEIVYDVVTAQASPGAEAGNTKEQESNPGKWYNYFFKK